MIRVVQSRVWIMPPSRQESYRLSQLRVPLVGGTSEYWGALSPEIRSTSSKCVLRWRPATLLFVLANLLAFSVPGHCQVPAMVSTHASSPSEKAAGFATVTASSAKDFVESTGVVTHWSYPSYYRHPEVQSALVQALYGSGIRHIRDSGAKWNDEMFRSLAGHGITLDFVADSNLGVVPSQKYWCNRNGLPDCLNVTDYIKRLGPGVVDTVESLNECNYYCAGYYWYKNDRVKVMYDASNTKRLDSSHSNDEKGWVPFGVAYTNDLCDSIHADPSLNGKVKCIGASVGGGENRRFPAGSMAGHVDYANAHSYPSGEGHDRSPFTYDGMIGSYGEGNNNPSSNLDDNYVFTSWGPQYSDGTHPTQWAVTETGYSTIGPEPNTIKYGVHETVAAKYLPRLFAEYWRRGITRTYLYELFDEGNSSSDYEEHFGLIRHDLTLKPEYTAIASLLHLLDDQSSQPFKPQVLRYGESVEPNGAFTKTEYVHDLLLQKGDGAFYLLLWHEISDECMECVHGTWVPNDNTELSPPALRTTITLPSEITSAILYTYDANWKLQPAKMRISAGKIVVDASDKISVIRLSKH